MHSLTLSIILLCGTASTSLPLTTPPDLQLLSNNTLQALSSNTTAPHNEWPALPFHHQVRGKFHMTITMYGLQEPSLEQDQTLRSLIALEQDISYGGSPFQALPSVATFNAGKLVVTFFREKTHTISRKQASLLVHALWELTSQYGPKTIWRSDFEVAGIVVAHFILNLEQVKH